MTELFNYISEVIIDAIFPHRCSCGKWGEPICKECLKRANIPKTDLCPICKKISDFGRICSSCRYKSELTGVMIVGAHEGILKDAVWRLKYNSIKDISSILANLAVNKYGEFIIEKRFVITAIPITKERLHWRGYNQAELIGKVIATNTSCQFETTLSKNKDTGSQVGRSRKERLLQMRDVFVAGKGLTENKRVLIIDDVYTSGATLEEAAKALRKVGYREVWGLVITRD